MSDDNFMIGGGISDRAAAKNRIVDLESQLAAAKVEIQYLIKRNEYETYECGLCPTETDLSVGDMYCCNCFDEKESQLTAAKAEIETLKANKLLIAYEIKESENKRLREALEKIILKNDWYGGAMKRIAKAALDGGNKPINPKCCTHGSGECNHVCHRLGSSHCDSCCSCEPDGGKAENQSGKSMNELNLIADLVAQNCFEKDGVYESGCISTNADAIRYLCEKGWMEMVHDGIGRNCSAKFTHLNS